MKVITDTFDHEQVKWIDTRFELGIPEAGRTMYEQEHIEGAVYWDLERDMSDMSSPNGRHPMPAEHALTQLIQQSGLHPEDHIVIYDQGGSPFAARAWWLLKYAGFENVFISKYGFKELKQEGLPTATDPAVPSPSSTEPAFNREIFASREDVQRIVAGEEAATLVDARSGERYRGENEPIDPVAGHIPGARNFDWTQLVHDGRFIENADFTGLLLPQEEAVVYCGSGVTAAVLSAMLAETGHENVRLYAGSFSDWISDESNPVEFIRPDHPEAADDATKALLGRLIAEGYTGEMLMKKFEYEKSLLEEEGEQS
ncbi:sulfurtransferase [Planococcus lenghuensis]|uniref:Sulfurtransferase n=1 Tax=Planococcus lenghuensis TaxID=2213202 RepID=A0A1Q2KZI1_9BACL|nr:sulfurtransferase [Planococcus lenghuensis]AQQ53556.1 sulfurtransferase [Planococcus lenghuensis]